MFLEAVTIVVVLRFDVHSGASFALSIAIALAERWIRKESVCAKRVSATALKND